MLMVQVNVSAIIKPKSISEIRSNGLNNPLMRVGAITIAVLFEFAVGLTGI